MSTSRWTECEPWIPNPEPESGRLELGVDLVLIVMRPCQPHRCPVWEECLLVMGSVFWGPTPPTMLPGSVIDVPRSHAQKALDSPAARHDVCPVVPPPAQPQLWLFNSDGSHELNNDGSQCYCRMSDRASPCLASLCGCA